MGEGDGTVSLLSLGAMCVEGWKRPRWNPGGIKITTVEVTTSRRACAMGLQPLTTPLSPSPSSHISLSLQFPVVAQTPAIMLTFWDPRGLMKLFSKSQLVLGMRYRITMFQTLESTHRRYSGTDERNEQFDRNTASRFSCIANLHIEVLLLIIWRKHALKLLSGPFHVPEVKFNQA